LLAYNENECGDHTPSTGKTVDHESSLTFETKTGVDSRTEVGSNVDTGPLAHSLDETTTDSSMKVGPGVDEIHDVGGKVLSLPLDLELHLPEFLFDDLDVGSSATVESDHCGLSLFISALLGEPSRRVRQQEHTADGSACVRRKAEEVLQEKEDSGNNLNTQGHSPLSVGVEESTTVTDPVGDEETPSCQISL